MTLQELETEMKEAIDQYRYEANRIATTLKFLDGAEREYILLEMIDEMNRHIFYTFEAIQESIIEYLKEVK